MLWEIVLNHIVLIQSIDFTFTKAFFKSKWRFHENFFLHITVKKTLFTSNSYSSHLNRAAKAIRILAIHLCYRYKSLLIIDSKGLRMFPSTSRAFYLSKDPSKCEHLFAVYCLLLFRAINYLPCLICFNAHISFLIERA